MTMYPTRGTTETTAWKWAVGIGGFAGVMLVLIAGLEVLQGVAAISKDSVYVVGLDYVYELDVTAWGWIHVALGAAAVAVGIGILLGRTWGLIGGIAIAILATIVNFMFIPYYPAWSLIVIGFNILVIWACFRQLAADAPTTPARGYDTHPDGRLSSGPMPAGTHEGQRAETSPSAD